MTAKLRRDNILTESLQHGGGLLTVAFHARRWPGGPGDALVLPVDAVPALAGEAALAPGGRQVPPLVFSAGTPRPGTPPRRW
jgi:hypothetical protein